MPSPPDLSMLANSTSMSSNNHSNATTPPPPPTDPKKRHACPTCSRAFTTSGHLARHIRVHTGERNHKCPFPGCETRCSRQDNLQQHYRIHLSPGSRRSSSVRRSEPKKRSTLSQSVTAPPPAARSPEDPPDTPPALARATILPPLANSLHRPGPYTLRPDGATNTRSSPSNSSSGSPHSVYSSVNEPNQNQNAQATGNAGGSPFGNVLGLSHERTQSPPSAEYPSVPNPYPSYSTTPSTSSSSSYRPSTDSYSLTSSSYSLPPIHSLEAQSSSNYTLPLSRHTYPPYESSTTQWGNTQGQGYGHQNWWGGNATVGVVGAGHRGYAQGYGA